MLGKECEQAEKARAKVYAERARIMASRLGAPPSASQLQQAASSTAASCPKPTPQPGNPAATQPRPAGINFGPGGNSSSAPGPQPSASIPTSASSQQGGTPQRPSMAVAGLNLAMGKK
jgi:hypothetical protein